MVVEYKTGIQSFMLDDAVAWAHCASGCDNLVLARVDVKLAAVGDELEGDQGHGDKGDWDHPIGDGPGTDVTPSEQQVLFHCVSEVDQRFEVTVYINMMSLLKLIKQGFCTHAIMDKLGHEAVERRSNIKKQAETINSLRRMKEESERDVAKVRLSVQTQTETISSFERGAKIAV